MTFASPAAASNFQLNNELREKLADISWSRAQEKDMGLLVLSEEGKLKRALRGFSWQGLAPGLALVEASSSSLKKIKSQPSVIAAQENNLVRTNSWTKDPLTYRTWSLENRVKRYYAVGPYAEEGRNRKKRSIPDADIDLRKAWAVEKGSSDTKVAVIDTGVDPHHPDLQGNLWNNPGEIPDNEIDDDGNGFVDDIYGWNFYDNNDHVWDGYVHGTHVAGTIGARSNNNRAVPGINQDVSIINTKVLNDYGWGTDASIAAGVLYAIDQGARVINGSLGGPEPMPVLASIMRAHPEVLFVFAAGNEGNKMPQRGSSWPCLIQSANNICVGATNARDQLSSFSNYSKKRVHIAAPGEDILSLVPFTWGCPGDPETRCMKINFFDMYKAPFNTWTHGGTGDDWGAYTGFADIFGGEIIGLSDSLSGNYAPNANSWALSAEQTVSSPSPSCTYFGQATGHLENGEDVVRISLSTDGGATFSKVGAYTGKLTTGFEGFLEIPLKIIQERLPAAEGQTNFIIKYTLTSDGDKEYEGATILDSAIVCQGSLANAAVFSGTSMAAPHVAGVAALLFSHQPGASAIKVKRALLGGADKKKSLRGKIAGAKRLNAWGALRALG